MNTTIECLPGTDPATNVRTDLWTTMDVTQLVNQQELIMTRMNKISMLAGSGSLSIRNIYMALEQAVRDLNFLIEQKTTTR